MSRKKSDYAPRTFETVGSVQYRAGEKPRQDTFARIYESMLMSAAFKDLTGKQKHLYLICKSQFIGKRKPERDFPDIEELKGEDKFYLNWAWISDVYRVYSDSCRGNFYNDMRALEAHGFIETVSNGKAHRTKNIYKFSDKWKNWKAPPAKPKQTKPRPT